MRVIITRNLDEVVELSLWDIAKLLLGRELKLRGHAIFLRNAVSFSAFNLSAKPGDSHAEHQQLFSRGPVRRDR